MLRVADGLPGPTVLVTDVNLPGSDGFALAAAARQRWAGLRVVFISGRPMNRDGNLLDPRDAFLVKPFTAAVLAEVILRLGEREAVTAGALPEDGCGRRFERRPGGVCATASNSDPHWSISQQPCRATRAVPRARRCSRCRGRRRRPREAGAVSGAAAEAMVRAAIVASRMVRIFLSVVFARSFWSSGACGPMRCKMLEICGQIIELRHSESMISATPRLWRGSRLRPSAAPFPPWPPRQ